MSPLSFLNPILLWGLAAAAVPIILHLFNRQRYRVVNWGAMMFLKQSLARATRRLRFQNWLLMLLRILILSLFALALARPLVKTAFTAVIGQSRTDLVLLLDSSFSMAYATGVSSDFDNAKRTAAQLIDTLQRGDTVSIFLVSDTARPLQADPSFQLQQAKVALEKLKPVPRATNFLRAMEDVTHWLLKLRNPNREIYILTDGAGNGWSTQRSAEWEQIAATLKNANPRPLVRVLPVSETARDNIAVVSLTVQPRVIGANHPARVEGRIANFSRQPRDIVASLSVDGAQKATKDIHLAPAEVAPVVFNFMFPDAGPHRLMLDIGSDALQLDNRRYLAVDAVQSLPVLIADGLPAQNPFRSASGFLAAALQPTDEAVVKPTVIDAHDLASTDLNAYRAVVLANIGRIEDDVPPKLERYVASGRGLLIAPGSQAQAANYNSTLFQEGRYLLPAKLDVTRAATTASLPNRTAVNTMWRPELADVSRAQIRSWWHLEPGPASSTLARLENGDPFVVTRRLGDGRILQTAVPLDATWSDLPVHPVFVPLVHELIYELALSSQSSRNLNVGDPSPEVGFTTDEPGAVTKGTRAFAANLDSTESDLTPLTNTQREQIQRWLGANFSSDWKNLPSRVGEERFGRQFWRPLAMLVLLLALIEVLMTSRWSAKRVPTDRAIPQVVLNR